MKLIGVVEKKGEYQGNKYHNVVLHLTQKADDNIGAGEVTEVVKIKYAKLHECFGVKVELDDVIGLIGEEMAFGYDKFGTVNYVRILDNGHNTTDGGDIATA